MEVERKQVDFPSGSIAISVVRGRLVEKVATARIRLRTMNPEAGEDTRFDVLQIKTYPSHPKIPTLLVTIQTETSGSSP